MPYINGFFDIAVCDVCGLKLDIDPLSLYPLESIKDKNWSYEITNSNFEFEYSNRKTWIDPREDTIIKCDMCIRTEKINKILKRI